MDEVGAKALFNGVSDQLLRKGSRNHPLSACQKRRNRRIAMACARVKHVFGAMNH